MKKMSLLILSLILSNQTFAQKHSHSLSAHEHGAIKLSIALDGKDIELEIDGPSESFLGFEHSPTTKKEKNIYNAVKERWTKNFSSLIKFDEKLECVIQNTELEQIVEKELSDLHSHGKKEKKSGVHSEIDAKAKLTCAKSPIGSMAIIGFKKHFKGIKKLEVEVIGKETKIIHIKKESQSITL